MDEDEKKYQDRVEVVAKVSALETGGSSSEDDLALSLGWDVERLRRAVAFLRSCDYIETETCAATRWALTPEGEDYAANGTPEGRLVNHLKSKEGVGTLEDARSALSQKIVDLGLKTCMRQKWVKMDKETKSLQCLDERNESEESARHLVVIGSKGHDEGALLKEVPMDAIQEYKHRRLIVSKVVKTVRVAKGTKFSLDLPRCAAAELTHQMMISGSWENTEFKPANFRAAGRPVPIGSLHPLDRQLKRFRQILIFMGFEEMGTHRWVESAFWNFDALFQPQKHPARDAHDTFYVKAPGQAVLDPDLDSYVQSVKRAHEKGGWGSVGYRYDWSETEATKNVLRTHTTAVTAQMLHRLAKEVEEAGKFTPKKFFSIDRVFRNETLDATHLAEFHQIEGIVASRTENLSTLKGIMRIFYKNIGIEKLRFKPTYNPYTEPSMEIYGYHAKLDRWVEIGNSGVFRPEMLRPMGLDADVSVLGWGLSLERPTMIRYGVENIRELFGAKARMAVS